MMKYCSRALRGDRSRCKNGKVLLPIEKFKKPSGKITKTCDDCRRVRRRQKSGLKKSKEIEYPIFHHPTDEKMWREWLLNLVTGR